MHEIKPLTSLRGIAAMAVVMQHFSATAQEHSSVVIPSLVPHGYLAVDLFFVLSGFIMSYTYLASFQLLGLRAFPDFLGRRVARVVPLNVAVLVLLVLFASGSIAFFGQNMFFHSNNLPMDFIANLLMLQGLGIGTNLNGPSWSISTEFAAYLLFPLFVFAIFQGRAATRVAALIISVAALCWLATLHRRLGLDTDSAGQAVVRCFSEFALGMAAYRLYRSRPENELLGSDTVAFGLATACAGLLVDRL